MRSYRPSSGSEGMGEGLSRRYSARFFLGIAQKSTRRWRDECTMPLFTLPMILEAERTLAADAVRVLEAKRD